MEQKADESPLLRFAQAAQKAGEDFVNSPAGGLLIAAGVFAAETAVDVGLNMLETAQGQDSFVSPRSRAIAGAVYDAKLMTVTISFKNGKSYDYLCDPSTWQAFKSAGSKGGFYNDVWAE
jgi:hypothetical protein